MANGISLIAGSLLELYSPSHDGNVHGGQRNDLGMVEVIEIG